MHDSSKSEFAEFQFEHANIVSPTIFIWKEVNDSYINNTIF
jgi:hypothetical protein